MNQFFINSIQKIIKQREEQPPEQVDFMDVQLRISFRIFIFLKLNC